MSQREKRQVLVRADKWHLARLFQVHASSVHAWQRHEGLGQAALIAQGGPAKPAVFDGRLAIAWFRRKKLRSGETAPTLEDLKAIVARTAAPAENGTAAPARRQAGLTGARRRGGDT